MRAPIDTDIQAFRTQNGLALDEESQRIWMGQLGPFEMPLPNWKWRRDIVAKHDSHHLLPGYDTSAEGELLVAAWELGSRAYEDWRARALCVVLMALGMARYPKRTIAAFREGREVCASAQ